MFAIIGAGGNVGQSTSLALRKAGLSVRAIMRDEAKEATLREIGCEPIVADLRDPTSVSNAIAGADAVQVVIPLRPQSTDPVGDMRRCADGILQALERTRPQRVLLISDYGAHVDRDVGMPSLFRSVEARLRSIGGHVIILRSAEYIHNWARSIPTAIESGLLMQFQDPVDREQAAIDARDLGRISAEILMRPERGDALEVIHAEAPRRYSATNVAAALSELTGKPIRAAALPRPLWEGAFVQMDPELAGVLIKTNEAKNEGCLIDVGPDNTGVLHGRTDLIDALKTLLSRL